MNRPAWAFRFVAIALGVLALGRAACADTTPGTTYAIDLPTALRLAGAQNLDVQIARQALREAEAQRVIAVEQFFPWLSAGISYHRRDGMAQAVPAGTISETHFDSYAPGATIGAQVAVGDAIYTVLAARQLVRASDHALEAKRQDVTLSAASGYFELAKAAALVEVERQALETSQSYERQLHEAVSLGIAFKGDELRVRTQTEIYQIALRRALERQRIAAASLAQILHLDPATELVPQDGGLSRLTLFESAASTERLVQRALETRPEVKQSEAQLAASRYTKNGALYGPLIPSVGAQVFAGGLGGGHEHEPGRFGSSEDYTAGLSWRVGSGGLFDYGRIGVSKARLAALELEHAKLKDAITAEVVESWTRVQSLSDQITIVETNLSSADETLRLTRGRKQFGVGMVLEDIQAQQALNQARLDYFTTMAEFNTAQYALSKAVGGVPVESP